MNRVADRFLRAKSWQIFSLLFGWMLVSPVVLFGAMMRYPGTVTRLFFGVTLLDALSMNAWYWAMGSFLNTIIQPRYRPSTGFFRFSLVYPILYIPLFMVFFPLQPAMFAVIVPLHLLAMFCMFYIFSFVSKNLVLAETSKRVTFSDYAGPFFLLWFFPIGVWIIQPRINRLYAGTKKGEELSGVTAS